jgi:hypothetical protein
MPIYKCEKCEYQTKIKRLMNNHLNKKNPCKTEIVLMSKKPVEPKKVYDDLPSKESEESDDESESVSECEPVEPVKQIKPVSAPVSVPVSVPVSIPVSVPVYLPVKENPYLSFFKNQTKQENKNPRIKFI